MSYDDHRHIDLESQNTYEHSLRTISKKYYELFIRSQKKDFGFDLTLYDLSELLSRPCDYCGSESTGLDRKDNTKGYLRSNVTPACRRCNTLKGSQIDYIEMKEIGYELMMNEAFDETI